ncbi:P-II family nitrogen regulator [Pseudomonadota bacterium]
MSESNITVLTDVSLITCVVQRGLGDEIVKAAQEAGAQGATIHYGKGSGIHELLGVLSVAIDVEKEIINVVVANDQADRIFERVYIAGNLDTPGMGIIYMTKLEKAATHIAPEILERLLGHGS